MNNSGTGISLWDWRVQHPEATWGSEREKGQSLCAVWWNLPCFERRRFDAQDAFYPLASKGAASNNMERVAVLAVLRSMTFLEWNDSLAEHFFPAAKAGKKVHLFATHELIERLGRASGDDFENFVKAVKTGPSWAHRSGLCQRALEALHGWRRRGLRYLHTSRIWPSL